MENTNNIIDDDIQPKKSQIMKQEEEPQGHFIKERRITKNIK
jgi:hypothetical protein